MESARLVFSDTHLSEEHGQKTGHALAQVLSAHPGSEVILAGDIFDLSLEQRHTKLDDSTERTFAAHPKFRAILQKHIRTGGKITWIPGNHDAQLVNADGPTALHRALGAPDDRQIEVSTWFARRGDVHIEHGHLYDPDNAFTHPLADHNPSTEPLGTALMRRFVAPNDAIIFAHAHRTTPSSGLRTALEKWGFGAPLVIARYFATAFGLVGDSALHKDTRRAETVLGDSRIPSRAQELGLEPALLHRLLEIVTVPTHDSVARTFLRLYFDRIFAACSLATGLSLLGAAGLGLTAPGAGALLTAIGGGYLTQSVLREKNRYGGNIVEEVGRAADLVREAASARLVVFGHTHVPIEKPGYINLGSFGFGYPERPYLLLDSQGHPEVRRLPRS